MTAFRTGEPGFLTARDFYEKLTDFVQFSGCRARAQERFQAS